MTEIKIDHLLGRPFVHGSADCYGLGRAFYKDNYGIDLPNMVRPDDWWNAPEAENLDLYMRHFRSLGFHLVHCLPRDYRIGDVFLMAVYRHGIRNTPIENKGYVANHCGIYLGQGKMLHHFHSRLSEITQYHGIWPNLTVGILRHEDVPAPDSKSKTVDFMDMISPYLRRKLESHVPADPSQSVLLPDGT